MSPYWTLKGSLKKGSFPEASFKLTERPHLSSNKVIHEIARTKKMVPGLTKRRLEFLKSLENRDYVRKMVQQVLNK